MFSPCKNLCLHHPRAAAALWLAAVACVALGQPAAGQSYPAKPVRMISPSPQGGLDASSKQGSRSRDATVRESDAAAVLIAQALILLAQYPNRPVRMISPFPPGGGTDAVARVIAQALSDQLGQQVVVDSRGGANGVIGTEFAAKVRRRRLYAALGQFRDFRDPAQPDAETAVRSGPGFQSGQSRRAVGFRARRASVRAGEKRPGTDRARHGQARTA